MNGLPSSSQFRITPSSYAAASPHGAGFSPGGDDGGGTEGEWKREGPSEKDLKVILVYGNFGCYLLERTHLISLSFTG